MQTETILYIIIAGIAALSLALFQYIYKSKINTKLKYGLTALRTISLLGILLLIVNPKVESINYYTEKPNLVLAIDNSESISYLDQDSIANLAINELRNNLELNERFEIDTYTFSKVLNSTDSISFNKRQTNISSTLSQISQVYKDKTAPIILISDGNQTLGNDYSFITNAVNQPIYPLILGDSTLYSDLSIKQLNVNRYTFLKNRFPVEVILSYSGQETISTEVKIWRGNSVVYSKTVQFSDTKTSEIINTTLLANSVGVKTYRVELVPLDEEKNKVNNYQNFGVEVIDQKTNIALVYDQLHPDLGALKKSIESNEQRSVSILNPNEYISQINNFQLVILYQPNNNFNNILKEIKQRKLNTFIITGVATDYEFINNTNLKVIWDISNQTENFQPELNRNYSTFIVDNINFEDYPPLKSEFGGFNFLVPADVILYKTANGINTGDAMLATYDFDDMKHAMLIGEGIWRWRAQSYLDTESFTDFDNFLGKLIQYLSSNKKRSRLNLDYKSFYNGNEDVIISAQYFNKNFEFDPKASLNIILKNSETDEVRELPLLISDTSYRADISGIEAGNYAFTVSNTSESVFASGSFQILDYNVEQQFLNADINRLQSLANRSKGKAFYVTEYAQIINNLLSDSRYAAVQKSTKNIVPLINWKILLGIIALSLFSEWFIRKYNGLI